MRLYFATGMAKDFLNNLLDTGADHVLLSYYGLDKLESMEEELLFGRPDVKLVHEEDPIESK